MKQDYTDIIEDLSQLLSTAIQEREINLSDSISQLDVQFREQVPNSYFSLGIWGISDRQFSASPKVILLAKVILAEISSTTITRNLYSGD